MQKTTNGVNFDPVSYINNLMDDIGYGDAKEADRTKMQLALEKRINHLVINAISLYVEPDVIDETLIQHGDLEDISEFVQKLAQKSPLTQMAIIEALDNFYEETVEAYKSFD